jgi:hypothetical protein
MAVDAVERLPLTSNPHRREGVRSSVTFALAVALVFAASVLWPAFGKSVTLVLKIAVLYVFSAR